MIDSENLNSYGAILAPVFIIIGSVLLQTHFKYKISYAGFILLVLGYLIFYNGTHNEVEERDYYKWILPLVFLVHILFIYFHKKNQTFNTPIVLLGFFIFGVLGWCLIESDFYEEKVQYIYLSLIFIYLGTYILLPKKNMYGVALLSIGWVLLSCVLIDSPAINLLLVS